MSGQEKNADGAPQQTDLSQMETAMITAARARTHSMRGEPKMPADKSVSLFVTDGPLKGASFPIHKPQIVVGRSEADVAVRDGKASRKHCVLEIHGSTALLVDLDSANGTFVDEKKVTNCELLHMSEFRVGDTTLMLLFTGKM